MVTRLVGLVGATCALLLPAASAPSLVSGGRPLGNTRTGARGLLLLLFLLHLPISQAAPIGEADVTTPWGEGEGAAGGAVLNAQRKATKAFARSRPTVQCKAVPQRIQYVGNFASNSSNRFWKQGAATHQFDSQGGRDRFVHRHFFANKCVGSFVELGATNGKTDSNASFFEENLGWRGVCIEPNPELFRQLALNRPRCT